MKSEKQPGICRTTLIQYEQSANQICKHISGMVRTNKIPPDLPEICAQVFLNTKTTTFNVVMTNILLYARTETATWNEVL